MKHNGWYIVKNAYECTIFEIWRDFYYHIIIACLHYPYIRVYRLYDMSVGSKQTFA